MMMLRPAGGVAARAARGGASVAARDATRPLPRGGAACNARGAMRRAGATPRRRVAHCACGGAERTGGAPPQWLRKGGAGGKGVILEDAKTLADYGLDYTMGMFEVRVDPRHVSSVARRPLRAPAAAALAASRVACGRGWR